MEAGAGRQWDATSQAASCRFTWHSKALHAALQVRYVDGCMRTGAVDIGNNWTVVPGSWWLTMANRTKLAPGELCSGVTAHCLAHRLA